FDLMALQRNLKALGTFGYQTTARQNTVYIQYIPRTLRYARENLLKYDRFARLRDILEPHVEELRYAMSFALSTHLFHNERLSRAHLEAAAAQGFSQVEIFATRSHFDYHDARSLDELSSWLQTLRLEAFSLHL